jgi:1,4-dihydroxy-2-naphthoate octaprenyltransferase
MIGLGIVTTALISMSYSNNYYDAESDQYNAPTPFSGGNKDLIKNKYLYNLLKPLSLVFMGLSIILAVLFLFVFSFYIEFLLYVIIGNLLAWYYTAPPLKFSYRGFGEIVTVITAGLMIPGVGYFILAGHFDSFFLVFIIPFMLYLMIFILNAEIPDIEGDRKGKKMNIVVRKGSNFGLRLASALAVLAVIYFFSLSIVQMLYFNIDFKVITLFSIIPCIFLIVSIDKNFYKKLGLIRISMNNITSVILFVLLVEGYLLYVAISS